MIIIISLILTSVMVLQINNSQTYSFLAIWFSITGIMISQYTIYVQQLNYEKDEKIIQIEKSLESFYRPLQNLFNGHEDDPITAYNKIKYDDIGCYRHLAEPNTLRCFETCPQTNETLKELVRYVREDVHTLQDNYKKLKDQKK